MMDALSKSIRMLVIQNGARHNYQIPCALERAGVLSGVYTDLVSTKGLGTALQMLTRWDKRLAGKIERRIPPPDIANKIHTFGLPFVVSQIIGKAFGELAGYQTSNRLAALNMGLKGFGGATHLYTMFGEGGSFIEQAKAHGLGIIGDVYIAISADRIIAEEAALHGDWVDEVSRIISAEECVQQNSLLLSQADLLVCPSTFVRDDLLSHGIDGSRMTVAPYGVNSKWVSLETTPEPGRVLFAGSAILRKGIHTLAQAATLLGSRYRIRVAGQVSQKVLKHPAARDLEFLGHLSQAELAHEFANADVFAFPSLAEGAAGVTGEALGAGLPVVTTSQAGSVVRDGIEGHIIPARDPESLAEAVASIVENREKREAMSRAARLRARKHNWDAFARTVIDAIEDREQHGC
jgi:glycosyltransferase involved in cell wall biosynthesis